MGVSGSSELSVISSDTTRICPSKDRDLYNRHPETVNFLSFLLSFVLLFLSISFVIYLFPLSFLRRYFFQQMVLHITFRSFLPSRFLSFNLILLFSLFNFFCVCI